ncbi:MAG: hypothetical protein B7Z62_00255 [Deltaproteobacteria bacterium 37-65-8]|nr:MAG: hypothetical protein B7Z62_00255 [Deltaproteobacteria bacterium 37-65-8]
MATNPYATAFTALSDLPDPGAATAGPTIWARLIHRFHIPEAQATHIAAAIHAICRPGSPLSGDPIAAAYQAPLLDLLESNSPARAPYIFKAALTVAPLTSTPAAFARDLVTLTQASGIDVPDQLLTGAPACRTEVLRIRMSPLELASLKRAAAKAGVQDTSSFVRQAIATYAREHQ